MNGFSTLNLVTHCRIFYESSLSQKRTLLKAYKYHGFNVEWNGLLKLNTRLIESSIHCQFYNNIFLNPHKSYFYVEAFQARKEEKHPSE